MLPPFKKLLDCIEKASHIAFLTHYNPDLDGLSTVFALAELTDSMGVSSELIVPEGVVRAPKHAPKVVQRGKHAKIPDLIIIADTAVRGRVYLPSEFEDIKRIIIDHHQDGDLDASTIYLDIEASSAAEVLLELLDRDAAERITPKVAQYLLDGLIYDTQILRTTSTTSKTLSNAAKLLTYGADLELSKERVTMRLKPKDLVRRLGLVSHLEDDELLDTAWLVLDQATLAFTKSLSERKRMLDGLVNDLAQVLRSEIVAFIYEHQPGSCKVSLRSRKTNVHKVMSAVGGGGHVCAAGALVNKPPAEVKNELRKIIATAKRLKLD